MRKIDVVIVPDKEQVMRCQCGASVPLFANCFESLRNVDDLYFGMRERQFLPIEIVKNN